MVDLQYPSHLVISSTVATNRYPGWLLVLSRYSCSFRDMLSSSAIVLAVAVVDVVSGRTILCTIRR